MSERKEGWYWVKRYKDFDWQPVRYATTSKTSGEALWVDEYERPTFNAPEVVGPRIEPPKESVDTAAQTD